MAMDIQKNVSVSTFRTLLNGLAHATRDVVIGEHDGLNMASLARLGRCSVTSSAKALNRTTMEAFRDAIETQHGSDAAKIFDQLLGSRAAHGRSLRLKDIRSVLDQVDAKTFMKLTEKSGLQDVKMKPLSLQRAILSKGLNAMFSKQRVRGGMHDARMLGRIPTNRTMTIGEFGAVMGNFLEPDERAAAAAIDRKLEKLRSSGRMTDEGTLGALRTALRMDVMYELNQREDTDARTTDAFIDDTVDGMIETLLTKAWQAERTEGAVPTSGQTETEQMVDGLLEKELDQPGIRDFLDEESINGLKAAINKELTRCKQNGMPSKDNSWFDKLATLTVRTETKKRLTESIMKREAMPRFETPAITGRLDAKQIDALRTSVLTSAEWLYRALQFPDTGHLPDIHDFARQVGEMADRTVEAYARDTGLRLTDAEADKRACVRDLLEFRLEQPDLKNLYTDAAIDRLRNAIINSINDLDHTEAGEDGNIDDFAEHARNTADRVIDTFKTKFPRLVDPERTREKEAGIREAVDRRLGRPDLKDRYSDASLNRLRNAITNSIHTAIENGRAPKIEKTNDVAKFAIFAAQTADRIAGVFIEHEPKL